MGEFRRAVAACPHERGLRLELARALFMAQRLEEARKFAEQVLADHPRNVTALLLRANALYLQGEEADAVATFQRVIEIDPKNEEAVYALGRVYYQQNRFEPAVANLANLLMKRGENEKAFQLASEAAVRNPASARNFYLTGKALARLEKPDLAVKWLKQSTELDPTYPEPRYLLGQTLLKLGKKEEAQREFQAFEEVRAKPRPRR